MGMKLKNKVLSSIMIIIIICIAFGFTFIAALFYLIERDIIIALIAGASFAALISALGLATHFITHADKAIRDRRGKGDGGWHFIDPPLSSFVFGILAAPFLFFMSISSLWIALFSIFTDETVLQRSLSVAFFVAIGLVFFRMAGDFGMSAYRFLFVKTRFDDTRIERRGPIGRGRSIAFRQIHSAGWNSKLLHIWIRSEDEGRLVISCSDFGAYDFYTRLRTELGPRYVGKPWPMELNPRREYAG